MRETPVTCFVDTGSAVNLVTLAIVKKIGVESSIVTCKKNLRDFGGNRIPLKGEILMELTLGGRTSTHRFVVCYTMHTDILLGHPFLNETGSCINYAAGHLERKGARSVPFREGPKSVERIARIEWLEDEKILPNTMRLISGKVTRSENCVGVITPDHRDGENGLLVAEALGEVRGGEIHLKVLNVGDESIKLRAGERAGQLEPIPDYSPMTGVRWEPEDNTVNGVSSEETRLERWTKEELFGRLNLEKCSEEVGEEDKRRLKELLWKRRHVFSKDEYDIGCSNFFEAEVNLKHDAEPRWTNPIPTAYKLREEMKRNISEMMKAGVVEELDEPSEWNSPIFLVKKKAPGSYRLVADLRNLNKECMADSYPLPNLNHVLDTIGGDKLYSSMDLAKGFWQVPYSERSKKVTAFLHDGRQYAFSRMIMGHKNSSASFTRMMRKLLETVPIKQVIHFIDDIFLSSSTVPEHLERLDRLLGRFEEGNLKISPDKTELVRKEVKFVGVSVSEKGVRITEDRVKDLLNLRSPISRKEVMAAMGAFNYVRKWVKNYSTITRPIYALLKGGGAGKFKWTEDCERSYTELKRKVAEGTTLAVPDPSDPWNSYQVHIDASVFGIGATLS